MPLVRVETSHSLPPAAKQQLVAELSRICAEEIGKPECYVQAVLLDGATILHGGEAGPAAFCDVRSIGGLSKPVCRELSKRVCAALAAAGVAGERVYLNFTDVPAAGWGHDGGLFG